MVTLEGTGITKETEQNLTPLLAENWSRTGPVGTLIRTQSRGNLCRQRTLVRSHSVGILDKNNFKKLYLTSITTEVTSRIGVRCPFIRGRSRTFPIRPGSIAEGILRYDIH